MDTSTFEFRSMVMKNELPEKWAKLRDAAANAALTGLLASGAVEKLVDTPDLDPAAWLARAAYEVADAMMERRKR